MSRVIALDDYRDRVAAESALEQKFPPMCDWQHFEHDYAPNADGLRGAQWPEPTMRGGLRTLAMAAICATILWVADWRR